MDIDAIIAQLKAAAPFFGGRVAGGAEWELTRDQAWLSFPAAYVMPEEIDAEPNKQATGLRQTVTHVVAVIVELDNSVPAVGADRRGQTQATDAVGPLLTLLWKALLNFRPSTENCARGYWFVGAEYLQSDRARLIWKFRFALETFISDWDGVQLAAEPLTDLRITTDDIFTGTQLGVFDVPLPQS